jgi:hypothetical protein
MLIARALRIGSCLTAPPQPPSRLDARASTRFRWACNASRSRCGKSTARPLPPLPLRTSIKSLSKDIEDAQWVERLAPAEGQAMTPMDVGLLGPDRVQHCMDDSSQVCRDRKRLCREAESGDTDHMQAAIWRRPCGRTSRDHRILREPGSVAPPTSRPNCSVPSRILRQINQRCTQGIHNMTYLPSTRTNEGRHASRVVHGLVRRKHRQTPT